MRLLKLNTTVAICISLFFCSSAFGKEFKFAYQKIIDISNPIELDLQMVRGTITVSGTDDNRLIIEATKIVRASNQEEAEEVADHIEIKVRDSHNKVTVETNYLTMLTRNKSFWRKIFGGGSNDLVHVAYHIKLPFGSSISVEAMAAIMNFTNIEGKVSVVNTSGSVSGEYIFGPISIRQHNGNIDLNWIEGDIRIKSTSGKINLNQTKGAIDLSSERGNVAIRTELESPRDYMIETATGTINFLIPSSSSGRLKIETSTGKIKSEMPIEIETINSRKLVGRFGRGGPKVSLISMSGDVNVLLY